MARRVPKDEEDRLRNLPLLSVLDALGLYWKKDPTYAPRGNKSKIRIHLTIESSVREIIITGPKFYDTNDAKFSGGCAIDLVEKVKKCDYLPAIAVLRSIYKEVTNPQMELQYLPDTQKVEQPRQRTLVTWKTPSNLAAQIAKPEVAAVPRPVRKQPDARKLPPVQAAPTRQPLSWREPSAEKADATLKNRNELIAMYRQVLASTPMNSRERETIEQRLKELEAGR